MLPPDAPTTLALCGAIAAIAVTITSLETLASWRDYASDGVFDGSVLALHTLEGNVAAQRALGWLFTLPALVALTVVRLACAVALLLPGVSVTGRGAAAACAFIAGGILVWRNRYGTDGSDQMTAVVLAGVAVGSLFPSSPVTQLAAIAFIAIQGCLSYIVAGIAKASSPVWQSGAVLGPIMQTETWGSPRLAPLFVGRRTTSLIMAWAVIAAECAFPLVFVGPSWLVVVLLAWGFGFHVFCAVVMGLNTFLWAFVAAYPAIFYIRALVAGVL